jgi:hypothetical protein
MLLMIVVLLLAAMLLLGAAAWLVGWMLTAPLIFLIERARRRGS